MSSTLDLYRQGLLDARAAIALGLHDLGWPISAIEEILTAVAAPPVSDRAPYRKWTDAEIAEIDSALDAAGWSLPNTLAVHAVAVKLDRTAKSVASKMERRLEMDRRMTTAREARARARARAAEATDL